MTVEAAIQESSGPTAIIRTTCPRRRAACFNIVVMDLMGFGQMPCYLDVCIRIDGAVRGASAAATRLGQLIDRSIQSVTGLTGMEDEVGTTKACTADASSATSARRIADLLLMTAAAAAGGV